MSYNSPILIKLLQLFYLPFTIQCTILILIIIRLLVSQKLLQKSPSRVFTENYFVSFKVLCQSDFTLSPLLFSHLKYLQQIHLCLALICTGHCYSCHQGVSLTPRHDSLNSIYMLWHSYTFLSFSLDCR